MPSVLPLLSTSVSDAPTGALPRFTRPTFVRNAASDSIPVRKSDCCSSPSLTCGTAWPYVPTLPVVKVRLVILRFGVDAALCASMASAPAPLAMPKRSSRALPSVIDCLGAR